MGHIIAIFTSYAQLLFQLMQGVIPGGSSRPALVDVEATAMPSAFYFELVATSRSQSGPPYRANMQMKIESVDAPAASDSHLATVCARCTPPAVTRKPAPQIADMPAIVAQEQLASPGSPFMDKDKDVDEAKVPNYPTSSSFTVPPPTCPSLLDLPIPSSSSFDSFASPPTPTLSRGSSHPVSLLYPETPSPPSSSESLPSYPSTPSHLGSRPVSLLCPSTPNLDRVARRTSKRVSRRSGAQPLIGLGFGFTDNDSGRGFSGIGLLSRRASIISSDGSGSDVTDARDEHEGTGRLKLPSRVFLDEIYDTFTGDIDLDALVTPARPAGSTKGTTVKVNTRVISLLKTPLVDDVFREDEVSYHRAVLSTPRKAGRKYRNRGRLAYEQQTAASAGRRASGFGSNEGGFGSQASLTSSVGSERRPRWKY